MKILLNKKIFLGSMIAFAMFLSFGAIAYATSTADIEFPVQELDNCKDKKECKTFCDASTNQDKCRAFAKKHNLGKHQEKQTEKFDVIKRDGGPGNCAEGSADPHSSCEEYCDQAANMRECVTYARNHGLMEQNELEEAEKVINALDRGVSLPAACTDTKSCRSTCEDPSDVATARSCFAFAQEAGLLPPGVDKEKAEKLFTAIEEGRAPFQSPKDFDQCENPPNDEVFQKCLNFAIEHDFIPPEELKMIQKTGGRGPGGCLGKNQCENYCEANQEECFDFAKEHDLLSSEDQGRIREGARGIQSHFDGAPVEVRECIKTAIGSASLESMFKGDKPPSRDMENAMRKCFESNFRVNKNESGDFRDNIDHRDDRRDEERMDREFEREHEGDEFRDFNGEFKRMMPEDFDINREKVSPENPNFDESRREYFDSEHQEYPRDYEEKKRMYDEYQTRYPDEGGEYPHNPPTNGTEEYTINQDPVIDPRFEEKTYEQEFEYRQEETTQ